MPVERSTSQTSTDVVELSSNMAAKKRTGHTGAVWGDAEYDAAGYGRITLRLPKPDLKAVETLAKRRGLSRAKAVAQAVEEANARDREPGSRK